MILYKKKLYISSLNGNKFDCFSGSRSGAIYHHDVRVANHHISTLNNHSQEVCGLAWSPDGRYLASGGNDNLLNIWDATLSDAVSPLHTFSHHQAAVKVSTSRHGEFLLNNFWIVLYMYESYFVISSFQLGFYLTKIKVLPQQWTMFFYLWFWLYWSSLW